GLTSDEIARAFLVPAATVQARITRAKKTLAAARVPFAVPPAAERAGRAGSVLSVISLIFPEGSTASSGGDLIRFDLAGEAQRLARVLARLMPDEPEAHGLLALLELTAARFHSRTAGAGIRPRSAADGPPWPARSAPGAASARTACRRRSRNATRSPRRSARPTGSASCSSTRRSAGWRRRRWSTSTGRSRSPWPRGRPPGWPSWTSCWTTGRCRDRTCCRASAASCSPASAAATRRAASSSGPRRCAATSASARCCGARSPASPARRDLDRRGAHSHRRIWPGSAATRVRPGGPAAPSPDPADTPGAGGGQQQGGGEEQAELVPLQWPVPARWLVGHHLVVGGGEAGDAVVHRVHHALRRLHVTGAAGRGATASATAVADARAGAAELARCQRVALAVHDRDRRDPGVRQVRRGG